ncbi:MAG: hypothetical protein ABJN26_14190 [Stappiaceae bacterium]
MKNIFIILLCAFGINLSSSVKGNENEGSLYVFSIYDSVRVNKRDNIYRETVDLSGLNTLATIVLTAAVPMNWSIKSDRSDLIKTIILGGSNADKSSVKVNGKVVPAIRRKGIPSPTRQFGRRFRRLITVLKNELSYKKIDGILSHDKAPPEGLQFRSIKYNNPLLDEHYLKGSVAKSGALPDFVFKSNIRNEIGMYTLDGQKVVSSDDLQPLNRFKVHSEKIQFEIASYGLFRTSRTDDEEQYILFPEGELQNNRPVNLMGARPIAVAWDRERNRVLGVWNNDYINSFFIQYDLEKCNWINYADLNHVYPVSLFYDNDEERYVLSYVDRQNGKVSLALIDRDGVLHRTKNFDVGDLPGFRDLYDNQITELSIAFVKGKWVVLTAAEEKFNWSKAPAVPEIVYLYDLETQNIYLTYYEGMSEDG